MIFLSKADFLFVIAFLMLSHRIIMCDLALSFRKMTSMLFFLSNVRAFLKRNKNPQLSLSVTKTLHKNFRFFFSLINFFFRDFIRDKSFNYITKICSQNQ
jgi:hypothetical protein